MTIALETGGLETSFGGLGVRREPSLKVAQGARHALVGANGAGASGSQVKAVHLGGASDA
jgi:ABC-type branched-subunit amino acid transport system ATPase component